MPEKFKKQLRICLGERESNEGKNVIGWLIKPEDGLGIPSVSGNFQYWAEMKRWSGLVVGGIYEFTGSADSSGWFIDFKKPNAPRYTGERISDIALLRQWEAEDRTAQALTRARQVEKRHAENTELDKTIDALRNVYIHLAPAQRRAFLVYVQSRIERGK